MDIIFSDINLESPASGTNDLAYNIDAVRLSIFTIFSTFAGERLFMPTFGSSLESLLFEPMSATMSFYIKNEIFTLLEKWEPRIAVDKTKSSVTPNFDLQRYLINLVYQIPALNAVDNLSFNLSKSK